jgi:hypothetical protein
MRPLPRRRRGPLPLRSLTRALRAGPQPRLPSHCSHARPCGPSPAAGGAPSRSARSRERCARGPSPACLPTAAMHGHAAPPPPQAGPPPAPLAHASAARGAPAPLAVSMQPCGAVRPAAGGAPSRSARSRERCARGPSPACRLDAALRPLPPQAGPPPPFARARRSLRIGPRLRREEPLARARCVG